MAHVNQHLPERTTAEFAIPEPPDVVPRAAQPRVAWKDRGLGIWSAVINSCLGPREPRAFGILLYHRVCHPPNGHAAPTWNVIPERFEQQLTGLIARGWQAWPLRQVVQCMQRELPIPRKTFVITFDGGFVNNLIEAAPILTKLHLPATLFLATKYLDAKQPFPWDDWSAAGLAGVPSETWRPLTTDECRRLSANGLIELGAHTHSHADFRGRPDALRRDLQLNLVALNERFGVVQPPLAFPYGMRSAGYVAPDLVAAAMDAGALCGLSAEAGLVRPGNSPFAWGRFVVGNHDTAASLAAKLGGWHSVLGAQA